MQVAAWLDKLQEIISSNNIKKQKKDCSKQDNNIIRLKVLIKFKAKLKEG